MSLDFVKSAAKALREPCTNSTEKANGKLRRTDPELPSEISLSPNSDSAARIGFPNQNPSGRALWASPR